MLEFFFHVIIAIFYSLQFNSKYLLGNFMQINGNSHETHLSLGYFHCFKVFVQMLS